MESPAKPSARHRFTALVTLIVPAVIAPTVTCDPADDHVLACALGANARLNISGDAHLLDLKNFRGIDIVTAASAVERVVAGA